MWVLWKSSKRSELLSHLSSPKHTIFCMSLCVCVLFLIKACREMNSSLGMLRAEGTAQSNEGDGRSELQQNLSRTSHGLGIRGHQL